MPLVSISCSDSSAAVGCSCSPGWRARRRADSLRLARRVTRCSGRGFVLLRSPRCPPARVRRRPTGSSPSRGRVERPSTGRRDADDHTTPKADTTYGRRRPGAHLEARVGVQWRTVRSTGVGINNFQVAEGTLSPLARRAERGRGVRWGAAHNTFISGGAELGVPGSCSSSAGSPRRSRPSVARRAGRFAADPPNREVSRLAQTLMASLLGFVVGSFFLSLAYSDIAVHPGRPVPRPLENRASHTPCQ